MLVRDHRNRPAGWALWSPRSEISLRLLDPDPDTVIDAAWWRKKIAAAAGRRTSLETITNAYRVVHGEADGCPSLICDRYDRWAVVQLMSAGLEAFRKEILEAIVEVLTLAFTLSGFLQPSQTTNPISSKPMTAAAARTKGLLLGLSNIEARSRTRSDAGSKRESSVSHFSGVSQSASALERGIDARGVLLLGVCNVTPDSFSDGGKYLDPDRAFARALELEEEGADIVDIGAESTRPGSARISEADELRRLVPVLKRLKNKLMVPVSVDTYKSGVAAKALELGAEIVNDPTGLTFDPQISRVVTQNDAGLILNHMRGTPETWAKLPPMRDVVGTILIDLESCVHRATRAG